MPPLDLHDLEVALAQPADSARTQDGSAGHKPRPGGKAPRSAAEPAAKKLTSQAAAKPAEHKPRMPTHLERKMQDARKTFNRKLAEESDPNSPASPARLLKMLAQMEAVAERFPQQVQRRSRSARFPAKHDDAGSNEEGGNAALPASSRRSMSMPRPQQTAPCGAAFDGTASRSRSTQQEGAHEGGAATGEGGSSKPSKPLRVGMDLWGRGRATPHINLGLSILPTATQDLERDKTLYYSPIGGLASTAPHQYSKTLREGMLMYFSPSKSTLQLQSWARMDNFLQHQLEADLKHLPISSRGKEAEDQQQPARAAQHSADLNYEQWIQGLRSDIGYVGDGDLVTKRVEALADRLDVHPNDLWDLLDRSTSCAASGQSDAQDRQTAVNAEASAGKTEQGGSTAAQANPGTSAPARSGLSRSTSRNISHARLVSILKRAPVVEAEGMMRTHRSKRTAQPLIKTALTRARHMTHTLKGTPLTADMMYGRQSTGHLSGAAGQDGPTQGAGVGPGSDIPLFSMRRPPAAIPPSSPLPPDRMKGASNLLTSPLRTAAAPGHVAQGVQGDGIRPAAQEGEASGLAVNRSRSVSPSTAGRGRTAAGQQSPTRARSPNLQHSAEGSGCVMSGRYAEAARAGEWQPAAPGAIRPGTGEAWDYTAGVQNKQLAQQLYEQHQDREQVQQQAASSLSNTDALTTAPVAPRGEQARHRSVSPRSPSRLSPTRPERPTLGMMKQQSNPAEQEVTDEPGVPQKQHVNMRAARASVGRGIIRSVLQRAQHQTVMAEDSPAEQPVNVAQQVQGLAYKFGIKLPPAVPPPPVVEGNATMTDPSSLIQSVSSRHTQGGSEAKLVDMALQRLHCRGGGQHKPTAPGMLHSAGSDSVGANSTPRASHPSYHHAKAASAPLMTFESKSLSQSRVVLSQVQDVRHMKHVLWVAERELVPIVHRRRQQHATALLQP